MTTLNPEPAPLAPHVVKRLAELRAAYPASALKRDQIMDILVCCGLTDGIPGAVKLYSKYRAAGLLVPLRDLIGAKQARYDREHVLDLIRDALSPLPMP